MRIRGAAGIAAGAMIIIAPWVSHAQSFSLPGSADGSRVQPTFREAPVPSVAPPAPPIEVLGTQEAPQGARELRFELKKVEITGATALSEAQLSNLYAPFVGHTVTLDMAWVLAKQITDRYKEEGYFLSRAYVPAQTIEDGTIKIVVVEGFVDEVVMDSEVRNTSLLAAWIQRIQSHRPITTLQLEEALLSINDIPGVSFRAVLEPPTVKKGEEGAVKLNLIFDPVTAEKKNMNMVRFDNNGSKYLGPYAVSASTERNLILNHKTSLSAMVATQMDELKTVSVRHEIPLAPKVSMDINGGYTSAAPGYTLRIQDIQSDTITLGVGAQYQWIRQRQENLISRLGFEMRNTKADILDTPLTRDELRLLRLNVSYDTIDDWRGYNTASMTMTKGLEGFGASEAGNPNASRAEAKPDFSKMQFSVSRLQMLGADLQAMVAVDSQLASGPLYSSEEFGYGGQAFGRAYDNSEMTGDDGYSWSAELRYGGLPSFWGINSMPYIFYDYGKVWNEDAGQAKEMSGSSAGLGVRANSELGVAAQLGVAFPLTRPVTDPLYSENGKAPRFGFNLSYGF